MVDSPFERSIRVLKYQERRRPIIASICFAWGGLVVGLSIWARYRAAEAIGEFVEGFYDAPMVAMPMVSAITLSMASSRLNMMIGLAFILFGIVRFFVPDFKTVVLLEVVEQLDFGRNNKE